MSIFRYLKDNLRVILFYLLLTAFMLSVDYFDRANRLLSSDIIYILVISVVMFLLYLTADYCIKSSHIKKLRLSDLSADKTPLLPEPQDAKDEVYADILHNLYNSYMESLRAAEAEYRDGTDFMTAWAHEIKTPITTARLLLESESLTEDELSSLREEIEKIENDVEKVLFYARSDQFSKDYLIAEENLHALLKESVKKHSALFIRKGIRLEDTLPDHFFVDTDRKWLLFIIDQLLSNALKYTPGGGVITVRAEEDGRGKRLIVEDSGTGIRSEDIKLLFKKSFTGANGRMENSRATGFGLYLSQKLAKKLGHLITIESECGKGTKATVHFPLWDDYYHVAKM